jgi:hypothetical protein
MAIYRGIGGAGDSTTDATVTAVTAQAVLAVNSAIGAALSASNAATSASNISGSVTQAANSATASANSAITSANSATTSAGSATNASTSKDEAAASAVSAANSAAAAELSVFGDRGTGVTTSYISTVAIGGTTFAQPTVTGEINSDEGYFAVTYAGATGITVTTLTSASTYVYIDNAGALQQQVTEPTRQDWSRKMFTMRIAVDLSTNLIVGFEYLNNPIGHYANSMRDIYSFLLANGVPFKKDQTITGRAGDLGFDVSSGTLMEFGGTGDINNANILAFDAVANAEFFLATRTAFDAGGNVNLPKFWDNAGTLTALGSTTVVGHRLYRFSNGNFVMQYGQGNYANITLAKAGAVLENYVLNPILENATFFGWWFIQSTATNTGGTTLTDFKEYTIGIQGGSSSSLSGALLKGNNLSDLLDAAASRTNLGLGTAATTDVTDYATAADLLVAVPAQTGNSGEFLTTDGTVTLWAAVDALPDQTGNSGEYLTTNGTVASWAVLDLTTKADVGGANATGTWPIAVTNGLINTSTIDGGTY